ncbi:MAG TPA: alkaline phosphatase family protein [Polyangia bacterium]
MGRSITVGLRAGAAALALFAVGLGCFSLRRAFIATWFRDAAPATAPSLPQPPAAYPGTSTGPAPSPLFLRVLLVDGLGHAPAKSLPAFSRFCAGGLDLAVDVGFPTVSLPVQAVLWTGRTQAQLGLLYRLKALAQPPAGALPARLSDSVAIAEEQSHIAGSFGFAQVLPNVTDQAASPEWASRGFAAASQIAAASDASLVFVHTLRVDKAGHKSGADSDAYRTAAAWADDLLAQLLRAAPATDQRRWVVLSDHGHRSRGGHAGLEPSVRFVRACIAGGPPLSPASPVSAPASGLDQAIHLIDVARLLVDSAGLTPAPAAVGRPLDFARAHPAPRATLPEPRWGREIFAAAIVVVPLLALVLAAGRVRRYLPGAASAANPTRVLVAAWVWLPIALIAVFLIRGAPSLSTPAIYPPQGRDLWIAGAPGFLVLVVVLLALGRPRSAPSRFTGIDERPPKPLWSRASGAPISFAVDLVAGLALLPALVLAMAALYACGAFFALMDPSAGPPLSAHASPLASIGLAISAFAAWLSAIAVFALGIAHIRALRRRHDSEPTAND